MLDFMTEKTSVWEKLKNAPNPIIVYGTGNGADKVFDIFNEKGIRVSGVTASGDFVRNRTFRGFPVKNIEFFDMEYGDFTVAVAFGTQIPEVMENIKKIAGKHRLLVPVVPVTDTEIFDEDFILRNKTQLEKSYEVFEDDFSREIYSAYTDFLFGGELRKLLSAETPESDAFENILKLKNNENFVDIGAYRGDTVDKFLKYTGGEYQSITAVEPDAKTFTKLMKNCGELPDFKGINCAVTGIDGVVNFSAEGGRQSAVGGENTVKSMSLSSVCEGFSPTFIKIDSEGCEYEILKGGENILKSCKPKLNVAAYHKSRDIFELPLLIKEINPDYKIYLRHHPYIPAWDTNLYCV